MDKTTILIADDHPLIRDGIMQLFMKEADFEVVGQAADGEEAIKLTDEKSPDVVVMDIEMPNLDGLEATKQIKNTHPETSVLVLTVHDDEEYIAAILEAGAEGYLLKTTYGKELVQAIRAVRLGEFVLDTQIGPRVFQAFTRRSNKPASPSAGENLTAREIEVMRLVGQGMTNEEISREINVSVRAVKGYLSEIFAKLGVSSRIEVITSCLHAGILSLEDISQH
jgi:DNA-binding NarL/FixJ family response regulator